MTHALNLTLPLKQDAATQARLRHLEKIFATVVQPAIDKVLKESEFVHFARVVIINDQYIQVLTEYDNDHKDYAEFFRKELTEVFKTIFELVEDAPDVTDKDKFWEFTKRYHYNALGASTSGSVLFDAQSPAGYLFSAYGNREVKKILNALAAAGV
jgi:hypothetical protein